MIYCNKYTQLNVYEEHENKQKKIRNIVVSEACNQPETKLQACQHTMMHLNVL